ncbi:hypothetical protein TNCV_275021 [Trichonephila clavipes]|nr:hypothetical protein TNCV_275021 [Trichonephila clavipes]
MGPLYDSLGGISIGFFDLLGGIMHIPTAVPQAITDSKTKFNYIIAHLPPEAATIIRDVIMIPDPVEPYEKARTELIKEAVNHPIKKSGN